MPYHNNPSTLLRKSQSNKRNNYKTFIEDPEKAVFLSGFRCNIPISNWKDYREAVYQDLNKNYNVYIKKLDLPVNSKYGYLHCGSAGQAEFLLNLKNEFDEESGKDLSVINLAGGKIHVYEYVKTEKRMKDECDRREPFPNRNTNVRENRKNNNFSPKFQNNSLSIRSRGYGKTNGPYNTYSQSRDRSRSPRSTNNASPNNSNNYTYNPLISESKQQECDKQLTIHSKTNNDSAFQLSEQASDDEILSDERDQQNVLENQKINFQTEMNVDDISHSNESSPTSSNSSIINNQSERSSNSSTTSSNSSTKSGSTKTINEVCIEATDALIYQHLVTCWKPEFSVYLDDQAQQLLMYLFIEACHKQGMDAAEKVMNLVLTGGVQQVIPVSV